MATSIKTLRKKNLKVALRVRRKQRVRKKIDGSGLCPRLSVFRSAKHVYIQAIDDVSQSTLASASTMDKALKSRCESLKKAEAAALVGETLGQRLKEKGVEAAVFDRNGYRFSGRIKAVADGVRNAGLNF
jgi:large subunit ribosomal protein L18